MALGAPGLAHAARFLLRGVVGRGASENDAPVPRCAAGVRLTSAYEARPGTGDRHVGAVRAEQRSGA